MSEHPAIVTDLYIGVTEVGVCVCVRRHFEATPTGTANREATFIATQQAMYWLHLKCTK